MGRKVGGWGCLGSSQLAGCSMLLLEQTRRQSGQESELVPHDKWSAKRQALQEQMSYAFRVCYINVMTLLMTTSGYKPCG